MEAEVRSYELSKDRSLCDRLYRNNQGSLLLLKFFEYLFQGEIIHLRGRLLISGGDIFTCLCYSCVFVFSRLLFLIANSYHLYVFVIIKKGDIVRTRFVLINILSFDDNKDMNFV